MKSHYIIKQCCPFLIAMVFSVVVAAQQITLPIGQKVAENYYNSHDQSAITNIKESATLSSCRIENNDTLIYIFNIGTKGYVVISGDYSLPPVLAFSDEGNFSTNKQSPALEDWLESYAKAVAYTRTSENKTMNSGWNCYMHNDAVNAMKTGAKDVSPLLTTKWDQGANYNYHCPVFPTGPGGHCYAGCVATAMAQVMKFYNYPEKGVGSYSYYHPYFVSISANFDTTYYDWSAMTNSINLTSREAISTLIYQCGVSVDMNYMPTGSGASTYSVPHAISTYFNYRPTTSVASRANYNDFDWHTLIVDNLEENHPLFYSGSDPDEGHAFVCDGYMSDTLFHFNWGWSGANNGYFRLDSLNSGNGDFTLSQAIVLDFVPSDASYCVPDRVFNESSKSFGDGSVYSYYRNNTDCEWLIQPMSSDSIILTFTDFKTESGKDFVKIYDGATTAGLLLGTFSGHSTPPQLIALSGSMLVSFTSDSVNQDFGWSATYNSVTTGIDENDISSAVKLFPVPVKDVLNLTIPETMTDLVTMQLYDITGQKVLSETWNSNGNNTVKFDVSSLNAGAYILELNSGKFNIHKKLIKQ